MKFDKYHFTNVYLENEKNNKMIQVRFEKDDILYNKLLPFIYKGKAESLTTLKVDTLYVPKMHYDDLCGKTYKMTADVMFMKREKDGSYSYIEDVEGVAVIDRVCFENINPMYVKPISDDLIKITKCDMEIQYQSGVQLWYNKNKVEEE